MCIRDRGTPSAPRKNLASLTIGAKAPVNMEDIVTNGPCLTRNRFPLKSKLSSIVEQQTVFNPKPDKVGGINAFGSNTLIFDAELQSAKGRNSKSVGTIFFPILSSSASVFCHSIAC